MENITATVLSDAEEIDTAIPVHTDCALIIAVSGKVDDSPIDDKQAADPGAIFRELWAINRQFESAWMSAYNLDFGSSSQDSPSDGGSS